MSGRRVHIQHIGKVLIECSARARRINISVKPFRGVRVAIPVGVPEKAALAFVESHRDWVLAHLAKMHHIEEKHRDLSVRFEGIDMTEARETLTRRVAELAEKFGDRYGRIFIRNQKTRWGSCSAKNNISLNAKLVRLPEVLMNYIILHELVHTRIKNHSRAFYRELDRRIDGRKSLEMQLRQFDVVLL